MNRGNSSGRGCPQSIASPRREPVLLRRADRAKVARALKRHDVVVPIRGERGLKTGEPQIGGQLLRGNSAAAIIEQPGIVGQLPRHPFADFKNLDRRLVKQAEVEEADAKFHGIVPP